MGRVSWYYTPNFPGLQNHVRALPGFGPCSGRGHTQGREQRQVPTAVEVPDDLILLRRSMGDEGGGLGVAIGGVSQHSGRWPVKRLSRANGRLCGIERSGMCWEQR